MDEATNNIVKCPECGAECTLTKDEMDKGTFVCWDCKFGFRIDEAKPIAIHDLPVDPLRYAGFWPRLCAMLADILILLPMFVLFYWGDKHYHYFRLYYLVPGTIFNLFYSVYLVRRFGGTPGKLLVGVGIRKVNGDPVGYREAFLRNLPDLGFWILISVGVIISLFHISDSQYFSLTFNTRMQYLIKFAPFWYRPLRVVQNIWVWSELIVLLTNRRRRALHDFIAGTVVVRTKSVEVSHINAPIQADSVSTP